jgi:hypothetical protein
MQGTYEELQRAKSNTLTWTSSNDTADSLYEQTKEKQPIEVMPRIDEKKATEAGQLGALKSSEYGDKLSVIRRWGLNYSID